jgi:hypothetical protein
MFNDFGEKKVFLFGGSLSKWPYRSVAPFILGRV